jgi:adenine/guanine phosphoribosyltransferase-like PRPP-binding protein
MATVSEIALSLTGICTSVPPGGAGVCRICHGCPNTGFSTCWSCSTVRSQVSRPCDLVVPISLYEITSQLHHVLLHYKSDRYPHLHDQFGAQVVSLLSQFLTMHGECIVEAAGKEWDVITTVPSSGARDVLHPLVTAINRVRALSDQYVPLLRRGEATIDHLTASDDGYELLTPLRGERILLIDDTFTSGSRVQSAASRLALGGGDVVGVVAIGRVIKPQFSPTVSQYWERQRSAPFTFGTCCIEADEPDDEHW